MREAKSNMVKDAASHCSLPVRHILYILQVLCSPFSPPLFHSVTVHSPSHFRFVKVGCQFLRFIRIMLKFLVSVLLQISNTFLFHQKRLKYWATRMVTDGTIIQFVCWGVGKWRIEGESEKILTAYKANGDLRRILHTWANPRHQAVFGMKLVLMICMKLYQLHIAKLTFGRVLNRMTIW